MLQIGGDRYRLTQYHFHALSEHTVNGHNADVEAHFHRVISKFDGYAGYPNNNRPVQPLNGRVVKRRRGDEHGD